MGASPATCTAPSLGNSNPASSRNRVLFPQPEAPTKTRKVPGSTVRSTGPSAVVLSAPLP
ncbi:Uncharacterised protein [Mycobacteroides abscessus subsp. massiliense]|nr:Uncharacterised protein [Mycobacteroides abscessus subsp. massiliense]